MARHLMAAILALILGGLGSVAPAQTPEWVVVESRKGLSDDLWRAYGRHHYPLRVRCRLRHGKLQVRFEDIHPAGPEQPFYKWWAFVAWQGESIEDVVAAWRGKSYPEWRYRIVSQCRSGGVTVAIAHRGPGGVD